MRSLKLIYKNMVIDRPKPAFYCMVALALLLCANAYFQMEHSVGKFPAILCVIFSLVCWFVVLPCLITIIDLAKDSPRINKIFSQK